MATLLHLDSSALPQGSASREVTAAFRKAWEEQHPDGTVVYRDLAADPLPHLDAAAVTAEFTDPADRTEEQRAGSARRHALADELERADAVLIGAPMYNFTIPSTLKAWLDHVLITGRTTGTENLPNAGTPVTVVASRGGAYGPGTPREGFDFVTTYLEKVLGVALGMEVDFIVPELTLARAVPAMAGLIDKADASRARADADAAAKGKALAARLAA
ncbi:FMN-dependent NADH-azoreductase [Streptomyces eurocidicus]|uniref:FMN dependent NADH:quinone oxidoreductase n=1 Tax=Streptomyces eurocidicus TaxID=66423 RepID=A0A2N8NYB4_STREU|nr:NAD(P)H-dependent oxidoreductase [Streptomyces eurocidicus]MBB5119876.1 FMN-dependent NADH-azoreductase [Streptomyces eurocidicus]MBF6050893.1 FMN-dependent NADH-azoreductase [Streptomyces eurocidicus]PNE33745.1 FMN-dependent NADH-azoreductase [Streptomyces eurocidicus]